MAVFDNDGTLWCEKPMPIELRLILQRLAAVAEGDESLRERQPWKAAHERDYGWLGDAITKHYAGDKSVKLLLGGVLAAFAGWTVDEYADAAHDYLHHGSHPTLGRSFPNCGYLPMTEFLRYLEANGFTAYIASGGDLDRACSPTFRDRPERVVGSSNLIRYQEDGGGLVYLAEPDVFDDGPTKPVRIWSRIGRRPHPRGRQLDGGLPMLQFAGGAGAPALRLLVLHDDADREFEYVAGAEDVLERARALVADHQRQGRLGHGPRPSPTLEDPVSIVRRGPGPPWTRLDN